MDVLQHAPLLTRAEAAAVARRVYGLEPDASPLSQNGADLAATLDEVLSR